MKNIPILGIALFAASAANAQTTIFDHTFDGSGATPLNGTAEDESGLNWSVGGSVDDGPNYIYADGEVSTRGGAVLAYSFGTGIYEVTSKLTVDSGFSTIGFTTSNPVVGSYFGASWANFGIRSNGDFEFWEGAGNTGVNDGGNLATNYGGTVTAPAVVGTLRMVLDWNATTNIGTIVGYYTPDGGSEIQIDLDDQTAGVNGNTISTGAALTGVGLTFDGRTDQGNSYQTFTMTSIPEPSSFALLSGLLALCSIAIRRRN